MEEGREERPEAIKDNRRLEMKNRDLKFIFSCILKEIDEASDGQISIAGHRVDVELSAQHQRVLVLEGLLDHPDIHEGADKVFCEFCGAKTRFTVNKIPFGYHAPSCNIGA